MSLEIISEISDPHAILEPLAWQHLRLDLFEVESPAESVPADRDYVSFLISSAMDEIADEINLVLPPTTFRLTLPAFPGVIELPRRPVIEVNSITYTDSTGSHTLSADRYEVCGVGDYFAAAIKLKGHSFPSATAVEVEFTAGFEGLPYDITSAILETVSARYLFRSGMTVTGSFSTMPDSARAALQSYRRLVF